MYSIPACMYVCMNVWIQECKNFPKIQKPSQNSRCQKDDINQVPFWGSTNTRHHHTKFSYHSTLAPSNCAHYMNIICVQFHVAEISILLYVVVNPLCCDSSFLHSNVLLLPSTPMHLSITKFCVSQNCSAVKKFMVFEELYGSLDQYNIHIKNLNLVGQIMLTWN